MVSLVWESPTVVLATYMEEALEEEIRRSVGRGKSVLVKNSLQTEEKGADSYSAS